LSAVVKDNFEDGTALLLATHLRNNPGVQGAVLRLPCAWI
jgi:hypothetical protein